MTSNRCTMKIYLYYKDRKQLKTFLTRIGSTIPLMPDPPVRAEGGGRGWRPIEIASSSVLLSKTFVNRCSPTRSYTQFHGESI